MMADCACDITIEELPTGRGEHRDIEYCPMHKAAPDLLKACKEAVIAFDFTRQYVGEQTLPEIKGWSWYDAVLKLNAAIAKAGKEEG